MAGFKPIRRYRLTFVCENTLSNLWTIRLSRTRAWLLGILAVLAICALLTLLFWATPLGNFLPGYMKPEERTTTVNVSLRLDSLLEARQAENAWLDNVLAIIGGEEPTLAPDTASAPTSADTLLTASDAERRFVDSWLERERFNLNVLTPAAASGMLFQSPVAAMKIDSVAGPALLMQAPAAAAVHAISEGTIIDTHLNTSDGLWTVLITHPNDFISRYDGLDILAVKSGQKVASGHALGKLPRSGTLRLTLLRAGTPLDPRPLLRR